MLVTVGCGAVTADVDTRMPHASCHHAAAAAAAASPTAGLGSA